MYKEQFALDFIKNQVCAFYQSKPEQKEAERKGNRTKRNEPEKAFFAEVLSNKK